MTELDLNATEIASADPLFSLLSLTTLDLRGSRISDLRPIKDLRIQGDSLFDNGLLFANCAVENLDHKL
ncbi:hypothetical protein AB9F26_05545 [Falsihalocynthiibacter sp. BN13B15]|uniref:hypothetical protein n=1 Tax=Falsihalocynthiibacter sp. BN13B15 TaxID=3240871 RepID=UPI00350F3552